MQLCEPVEEFSCYTQARFADTVTLNRALLEGFLQTQAAAETRRDHFFAGRYENIYISEQQLPQLAVIRGHIVALAARLLGRDVSQLRYGAWFNAMQPGDVTEPHQHDDYDELLSAVYYIQCSEHSGALQLMPQGASEILVAPQPGHCILFSPRLEHAVTQNRSQSLRLSLGMNIGVAGHLVRDPAD